jgi:poly-beta-1,6-N-acetyl-D-glucosamine synthase
VSSISKVRVDGGRPRERRVEKCRSDETVLTESTLACSVGVMAYNEEANIAAAIDTILTQRLTRSTVAEVIVVASGCEDRTAAIVAEIAREDPRVRLIEQQCREGKASAINLFIGAARAPLLLMVSADVLVEQGTFDALLRQFEDPSVGMVGGHPMPVNDESTFLGHAVHLQWRLHDRIARESPKLGEIVAFRNVVPSIPLDTAVDEISIQALVVQLGYRLVYEPEAVVYNRGPATVRDFLRQRRRIYAGHLQVREQQRYSASTMSARRVAQALGNSGSFSTPQGLLWTLGTIGLEATARGLGRYDVMRRRPQHVWEISGTTKRNIVEGANSDSPHTVAVFHIVNFHRRQLELGVHASRLLTRRVGGQIKRILGSKAIVSIQQSGTIVAVLPCDREAAEERAQELVKRVQETTFSLNGHGASTDVALAFGIVAFPPGEPIQARRPAPLLEAGSTRPIAATEMLAS